MENEFFAWLLFVLFFSLLPLKALFQLFLILLYTPQKDTMPILEEEGEFERHYAQLYRPGDRKYKQIAELSDKAKSINSIIIEEIRS